MGESPRMLMILLFVNSLDGVLPDGKRNAVSIQHIATGQVTVQQNKTTVT